MSRNSFAEKINRVKVMLAGLTSNQERISKRGISSEFVTRLTTLYDEARELDNQQEAFKAQQKELTVLVNQKMTELEAAYKEAKKAVKLEFPQESWKAYGIADKR